MERTMDSNRILKMPNESDVDDHQSLEYLAQTRLVRVAEAIERLASRTICPRFGLRNTDLRILNLLDRIDGLSVNELARRAHVDKAWISRSLQALTEAGLVERRRDEKDSRVTIITLTENGREKLEEVRPIAKASETRLFDGIDKNVFKQSLEQLMVNVESALNKLERK